MPTIDEYIISIRVKGDKKAKRGLEGVSKAGNSLTGVFGKTIKSVGALGAAFFGARALIAGMTKTIQLTGQFEKVSAGFENLTAQAGYSRDTLKQLTEALDGTASSADIMKQANSAMLLGIFESEQQMVEMFDIAQQLGAALGQDTSAAIESLTTGLGRQSKLMLDNLGIMVDTNQAYEDFAAANNRAADSLDDNEKKQAFVNAAIKSAKELSKGLGAEQLTTAHAIDRMISSASNLAVIIGGKMAPAVKGSANATAGFLESIVAWINRAPEWQRLMEQNKDETVALTTQQMLAQKVEDMTLQTKMRLVHFLKQQNDLTSAQQILLQELRAVGAVDFYMRWERGLNFVKLQTRAVNDELELHKVKVREVGEDLSDNIPLYEQFFASFKTGGEFTKEANDQLVMYTKSAIAHGRAYKNAALAAQDAAQRFVTAQIQQAVADYIVDYMKSTPLPAWLSAPLAIAGGAAFGSLMEQTIAQFQKKIKFAAEGMNETVTSPTLIVAGEAGPEHVNITPLGQGGSSGGVTVNINGGMVDQNFVENDLADAIKTAIRRGSDFGVA